MSFVCKVDREGNWAVGEPGGPVLKSSETLPRDDRESREYDLSHDDIEHAIAHAMSIAMSYQQGLC